MTGAEIVQINAAAQFGQSSDIGHHHVIVGFSDHGFQNLDGQARRGKVKPIQLPFQFVGQTRAAQFGFGKIHRDCRDAKACLVPPGQRRKRVVQHHLGQTFA